MKNIFFRNSHSFFIVLAMILCWSCGNENEMQDESPDELTFKEENNYPDNQLQQDNAQVDRNFAAYTYVVEPEDVPVAKVKPGKDSPKAVKAANKEEAEANVDLTEMEVVYTDVLTTPQIQIHLSELVKDMSLERPPLFGKHCLSENQPVKCSDKSIREFIESNLDYPDQAITKGHDGLEYVVFRVSKEGRVEDIKIRSKDTPCAGCAEAARNVVAATSGQWLPAMQEGKEINTRVTLPIRFNPTK